ncbi:MAG: protein kinase, partial [Cyanobacteria bacterium J06650_10]
MKSFVGQCLKNRYQVCELLGRQTGRRTFLANDLQTQTKVVLKLMLFGPDFSWEDLKLFEREAATLKSLDHPAIPCYLDYFELSPAETAEIGKGFALVQSYIETKSLQDWADEGRVFSGNDVKEIATQLLEVLIYLHGHQPPVVHRDIKPSNILLRASRFRQLGRVYLVDFGSVQTTQQEGSITIVGTYGYMPPEQFSGRANPASDLYSLGATLIYLLTCKHPADLPMRRGQLDFEVAELVGDRTQSWLQYLVHSSVVQRLQSARWALDTLVDENLPLQSKQGLYAKPHGSRVSLRKTTDRLEISFPRISIKQRLKIVAIASIQTLAIVLFAYLLELAMLFQFDGQFLLSTVAWVIVFAVSGLVCLKIWFDALSTLSASFQILMDAQTL